MKHRLFAILGFGAMLCGGLASCDTDAEALDIQKPLTYDEQYYANLRAFKQSEHEISYVYYADWAPIEGATGYKNPASWGERLIGLPDSLDIVNLWMGIPTAETHPVAYQDMLECQQKKGTRFVMHADASNYRHVFYDRDDQFRLTGKYYNLDEDRSEEALRSYARWACDTVVKCGLDGVDFDYEGWSSDDMMVVAQECHRFFGPDGAWPEKLFIVDYFSMSPSADIDPYCDYLIKQAYSMQGAGVGAAGHADEKTVYCESFGHYPEGGQIKNYAAWEPASGHKGGCGAFYVERNYYHTSTGVPYDAIRAAIQIMNPALHK